MKHNRELSTRDALLTAAFETFLPTTGNAKAHAWAGALLERHLHTPAYTCVDMSDEKEYSEWREQASYGDMLKAVLRDVSWIWETKQSGKDVGGFASAAQGFLPADTQHYKKLKAELAQELVRVGIDQSTADAMITGMELQMLKAYGFGSNLLPAFQTTVASEGINATPPEALTRSNNHGRS